MTERIVNRIEELFFQKLEEKTGWGRNHIKRIYKEAVREAYAEEISALEDKMKRF